MDKIEINEMIENIAPRYNCKPELLKAVVQIESNYKPFVVGMDGEIGLCQLLESGAIADFKKSRYYKSTMNFADPSINLTVGAWYLGIKIPQYLAYYGIPDTIQNRIIAYNAGIGKVKLVHEGKTRIPDITLKYLYKLSELGINIEESGGTGYMPLIVAICLIGLIFLNS